MANHIESLPKFKRALNTSPKSCINPVKWGYGSPNYQSFQEYQPRNEYMRTKVGMKAPREQSQIVSSSYAFNETPTIYSKRVHPLQPKNTYIQPLEQSWVSQIMDKPETFVFLSLVFIGLYQI